MKMRTKHIKQPRTPAGQHNPGQYLIAANAINNAIQYDNAGPAWDKDSDTFMGIDGKYFTAPRVLAKRSMI